MTSLSEAAETPTMSPVPTSVSTSAPTSARTYGGWRRPSSPGIGSLALLPTVVLLGGGVLTVLVGLVRGFAVAALVAGLVAAVLLPLAIRVGDRPAWREAALRGAWWRARRTGAVLHRDDGFFRGGAETRGAETPEPADLPGLLAGTRVWPAQDADGRPFALVEHPATGRWSVVLGVNPDAGALISASERDVRVAHWDRWLAGLGREPGIDQVAVVLDQTPDPGRALRAAVEAGLDPRAPSFARAVLLEAACCLPEGSPELRAHVTVTFCGRALRVASAEEAAVEIGTRLPGLSRALVATGSGEGRPLTAGQLAARVRGWFDPAVSGALSDLEARGDDGVDWPDAGPLAAQENWDSYRHDSGLSRTFEMVAAPRGAVLDSVLVPLTAPSAGLHRKRVTLLYRPTDAAGAPTVLDRQVRAAISRAGRRRDLVHAHDSAEVRAALQAAAEEATGAGVVRFSLLVTVTVDDEPELRQACEVVTRAARQAQLRLRPVHGAQAAAFAVGLGVGVVPQHRSLVPPALREAM